MRSFPLIALAFILLPIAATAQNAGVVVEELDAAPADDLVALERLAEQTFVEDDVPAAIALYRQLATRQTDPAEQLRVLLTVAWLQHSSLADPGAAGRTLQEALILDPDHEFRAELYDDGFRRLFLDAQRRAVEERLRRADARNSEGQRLYKAGDRAGARRLYGQALADRPDHPQALYNLALVDVADGRWEDALAGFQKVLALATSRPAEIGPELRSSALTGVGYVYNRLGSFADAEHALAQAVDVAPTGEAWNNLGIARRRLGDRDGAADAFRRAHELQPDDPSTVTNLSVAYLDLESWVEAVALLRDGTARFPDRAEIWLNLGIAQTGLGNDEGAVESFETVMRLDPDDRTGLSSRAARRLSGVHFEAGNHAAALAEAQKAVAWKPEAVNGWLFQGLAQKALGDLEAARRSFEEAIRVDPSNAEAYNNRGSVDLDLRRFDEAEAAFRRALQLQPGMTSAEENLAALAIARESPAPRTPAARQKRPPPPPPRRAAPPPPPRRRAPPAAPTRVRLGLRFADIDYAALGLKGVMVDGVVSSGTAGRAGIRKGDLLLKADGQDIAAAADLQRIVDAAQEPVQIDLLRDNKPLRVVLRPR